MKILLVPQCLRKTPGCKAKEKGSFFICMGCGKCQIKKIKELSEKNGYKLMILKGGKIIPELLKKYKPEEVFGIACDIEGEAGKNICENFKIANIKFLPLLKDGCSNTKIDLKKFKKMIEEKTISA